MSEPTWSERVIAFFAPPMEPSHDPQQLVDATFAARERLAVYESERAERMERYAKRWPADGRTVSARVVQLRPLTHLYREQRVG